MNRTTCISARFLFVFITCITEMPNQCLSQDFGISGPAGLVGADMGSITADVPSDAVVEMSSEKSNLSGGGFLQQRSRAFMIAGTGARGFHGDGEIATRAHLWFAASVAIDGKGNAVIADSFNNRIRLVDAQTGIIRTIAGTGWQGYSGDGDLATEARLNSPSGVAVDDEGNIFIADTFNNRIRIIDGRTGIISTLAGTGEQGSTGDEDLAVRAQLSGPSGITVDHAGNLLIADTGSHRIRKVDRATKIITAVAGSGAGGGAGDGGPAVLAELNNPTGVAVDKNGNILIADMLNNRVRRVDAAGLISTIAGTGEEGFDGDGFSATQAHLLQPSGVAADAEGNVFVADSGNNRIRRIDGNSGVITTLVGTDVRGHSLNGMETSNAPLNNPIGVTRDPAGNLVVADAGNNCILRIMP